jgi:RNA polymerase sigma factor (sigma-70 family)
MADENLFQRLICRVRAGDAGAVAELVQVYEPAIRRAARVRLVDPRLRRLFDSMDICQSVFASFFVRAALGEYDLKQPDDLLKLLVSMSRKKLIDCARAQKAARRDFRRIETGPERDQDVIAPGETPSQEVALAEMLHEFRVRLSDEERDLADQRAAGRDWGDIAVERGATPESLRKKLARAIDRVSGTLGLEAYHD